jgi:exopolyphosphatase/pppGpp-phosphohydrolase
LAAGLAASTRLNYSYPQRQYLEFCRRYALDPFKPTEELYCLFAAHEALRGCSADTISQYLSAVQSLMVEKAVPVPERRAMRRLHRVLNGIENLQTRRSGEIRPRLPISTSILLSFREKLNLETERDASIWAAFLTAFFGFLRPSEISIRTRNGQPISAPLLADARNGTPQHKF